MFFSLKCEFDCLIRVTSHREENLNGSSAFNMSTQSSFCDVYKYTHCGNF